MNFKYQNIEKFGFWDDAWDGAKSVVGLGKTHHTHRTIETYINNIVNNVVASSIINVGLDCKQQIYTNQTITNMQCPCKDCNNCNNCIDWLSKHYDRANTECIEYVKALSPQIKHATGKNIKELIYIGCAEAIGGVITDVTQTQNLKLNMDCIKKYELDVNMRTNIENQLRSQLNLELNGNSNVHGSKLITTLLSSTSHDITKNTIIQTAINNISKHLKIDDITRILQIVNNQQTIVNQCGGFISRVLQDDTVNSIISSLSQNTIVINSITDIKNQISAKIISKNCGVLPCDMGKWLIIALAIIIIGGIIIVLIKIISKKKKYIKPAGVKYNIKGGKKAIKRLLKYMKSTL